MISVWEQAGLIPATCSWDDNGCVRYVNPSMLFWDLLFWVVARGCFFFCVVSSNLCGKMIQFYKHTCSSGWTNFRWVFVVNGIADFVSLSFGQMVCSEELPEYSASR